MSIVQIVALVLLIMCVIALLIIGITLYNLVRTFNNNHKDNEINRIKSRISTTA